MTKSSSYRRLLRFRVDPIDPTEIEWTSDRVHLSRTCVTERAGLLGVPLRIMDILIDARIDPSIPEDKREELDARDLPILEIGEKRGRFSGNVRDRLTFRLIEGRHAEACQWGQLEVERQPGATMLTVIGGDGAKLWEATYPSLRWVFDRETDASCVVGYHLTRYYGFLLRHHAEDAAALAASFELSHACRTVSEANREASRALYRLARDLGWRKMTLRERLKVWGESGRDRPQWQRTDFVAHALSQTGVGEATLRAAAGDGRTFEPA